MIAQYKTRGSSMVETMVALFVLGVGLMGTLSLQLQSVKANKSAASFAQASYLAHDIVEAMRSTPENVADYYMTSLSEYDPNDSGLLTDCSTATANCSNAELVKVQQTRWLAKLSETLRDGKGLIQQSAANPDFVEVVIEFSVDYGTEDKEDATAITTETETYTLVTSI